MRERVYANGARLAAAVTLLLAAGCATGAKKTPPDPTADALHALEAKASANPRDARANYALGNAYFDARRYVDARAAYVRATEIDPAYADAFTNLGLVDRIEGKLPESIAHYQKALSIAPADAVTRKNLIVALQAAKQYPAAADQLKELSRQLPDDTGVTRQLAVLMQQVNRNDEAEAAYARLVAKAPHDTESWYALGLCQSAQGKRDAAIASWKTATGLDPDHAKAHAALADAYTAMGDYGRAWPEVRETQRVGGYVDPKLVSRLQELSGRTGPE